MTAFHFPLSKSASVIVVYGAGLQPCSSTHQQE
jgi:hypothetical protein